MDSSEFREFGKAMVDYIADYWDTIRTRDVLPSIEPGYLQKLLPKEAPFEAEHWKDILLDVERVIMPGVTHWHSPSFHAYYPSGSSFPGICGEMLSAGIGCIGFSWMASPACTELEVIMMNWLGKLLQLPEEFLNSSEGPGGGVIQGSASEATLVALLSSKEKVVRSLQKLDPNLTESDIKGKLVAYTSDQANSSVEKGGMLASVPMIHLPSDDGKLRGETLREAIKKDRKLGLIPCCVVANLGTTGTCAFDNLEELGRVCNEEDVWLHVDAAYAGSAFICPEYRHLLNGVEFCDSYNFNPHKWMLVNFDCSAMWVKNSQYLIEAFNVERIYLKHQHEGIAPDYRHWQIPLGRRFRALKLWFVLRIYGVEGIQKHIRNQISLAKHFEQLIRSDKRFEVCTFSLGLICFRLKGEDKLTQEVLDKITSNKKLYLTPCHYKDKLIIRFAVCSRVTTINDIHSSWAEIIKHTDEVVHPLTIIDGQNIISKKGSDVCKPESLSITATRGATDTSIEKTK